MQTIGTESKFLNELIVIRNEVNQAKTNPAVLSLVDVKLSVIIKEIQRNDSREVTWFLDHEESFKGRHTLRVKKVKTDWMLLGSEEFYVDGLERTPARYQSDFAGFGVQDALVFFRKLLKEDIRSAMCPDCVENSLFAGDDK